MADYNPPAGRNALVDMQKRLTKLEREVARLRGRSQVVLPKKGASGYTRLPTGSGDASGIDWSDVPEGLMPPNPKEGELVLDVYGEPWYWLGKPPPDPYVDTADFGSWQHVRPLIANAELFTQTNNITGPTTVALTPLFGSYVANTDDVLWADDNEHFLLPNGRMGFIDVYFTAIQVGGSGPPGFEHEHLKTRLEVEVWKDNASFGSSSQTAFRQLTNDADASKASDSVYAFATWRHREIHSPLSLNHSNYRIALRFLLDVNSDPTPVSVIGGSAWIFMYQGVPRTGW